MENQAEGRSLSKDIGECFQPLCAEQGGGDTGFETMNEYTGNLM